MPADTAPAWPDPARPGVPLNPERDGTHWLWVSQATGALMAFQWHAPPGPDRVGAWINIAREITTSHPLDAVRMGLTYCAPCLTPAEVAAREAAAAAVMRAEIITALALAGVDADDPLVALIRETRLPITAQAALDAREAAAFAAGAETMREMAEVSADCGCDVRAIVLERLASHGLREAERCCGQHYDACCALTAAAIRALPPPAADAGPAAGRQRCRMR